jgi:acetylornithine deacetylase/succinyl-diaminopimelate desuccinylase-like protein
VRDALAYVDENFESQIGEWIRITQIPAPSGNERERGAYIRAQMEQLGLEVTIDSIGNVIGRRPGTGGGQTLVFAAHMDTVHPLGTDLTVTRESGKLSAPGVFDNSASVTNMLAAARAIQAAGMTTRGDVIFIGTVREEVGLDGMSYWLDQNPDVPDMLVALDGGLGPILYGALGIYWSSMEFTAEGSHTLSSRGKPHPARAASRCILDIYDIPLPSGDAPVGAVYNVGMLRGGNVVNAIPQDVSFTVDLRTVDPVLLAELDSAIVATCVAAAQEEGVEFRREWISRDEAGGTPDQLADRRAHPLVQTAVDVLEYLGYEFGQRPSAIATGSTDANTAVVSGIPAISNGRSRSGNQHTVTEWADIETARIGTKQIILLTAALAEVTGGA